MTCWRIRTPQRLAESVNWLAWPHACFGQVAGVDTPPTTATGSWNLIAVMLAVAVILIMVRLSRIGEKNAADMHLDGGQTLNPVALELLEPVFELLIIGMVLADDVTRDSSHMIAGMIGAVIGTVVGGYRSRIVYVRAAPEYRSVVMERNRMEYAALVGLFAVKIITDFTEAEIGGFGLLVTGVLALAVTESMVRSGLIWVRYRKDAATAARDNGTLA